MKPYLLWFCCHIVKCRSYSWSYCHVRRASRSHTPLCADDSCHHLPPRIRFESGSSTSLSEPGPVRRTAGNRPRAPDSAGTRWPPTWPRELWLVLLTCPANAHRCASSGRWQSVNMHVHSVNADVLIIARFDWLCVPEFCVRKIAVPGESFLLYGLTLTRKINMFLF